MAYQVSYSTLPLAVPTKSPTDTYSYPTTGKYSYSVSPPETSESTASGPSYGASAYSATSASSYAGSTSGDYDSSSSASANGVDMQEYMQDRFNGAFDPLPLDRTLAVQAQT